MNNINDEKCVMNFHIGNTSIKIKDDFCCNKTPNDIEAILQRISSTVIAALSLSPKDDIQS